MGSLEDLFTLKNVCFYKLRTKTTFPYVIFKITYVALFISVGENQCALMVRKIQLVNISRRIPIGFSFMIQKLIFSFDCILFPFSCFSSSEFLPSFDGGISIIIIICFSWRGSHFYTMRNVFFRVGGEGEKAQWICKEKTNRPSMGNWTCFPRRGFMSIGLGTLTSKSSIWV